MANKQNPKKENYNRPNLFGALQNIFIAAINRGQLLIFGVFIILIVLICKMPADDASKFAFAILAGLEHVHLLGWIISLLLIVIWYFNSRHVRRIHAREMDRVAQEKTYHQEKNLGKLPSSKKPNK